jgi:hypothetical protein
MVCLVRDDRHPDEYVLVVAQGRAGKVFGLCSVAYVASREMPAPRSAGSRLETRHGTEQQDVVSQSTIVALTSDQTNDSIDRSVAAAKDVGAAVTLWSHPSREHGFDLRNHDAMSREIIRQTLVFLRRRLIR